MTSSDDLGVWLIVSVAQAPNLRLVLLILAKSDPHAWVHVEKLVLELLDHVVLLVYFVELCAKASFAHNLVKVLFLRAALAIQGLESCFVRLIFTFAERLRVVNDRR